MPLKPAVGTSGGQQYPVLRSIQKFLQQMAEGGARAAPTVIKELLQNADDAGASELAVVLDERQPPAEMRDQAAPYADLFGPALLVRNTAPFYVCDDCRRANNECNHEKRDDFHAIRDVAAGHKRAQATAAGRFGIGFNSVYFLTDMPLLFSRREVHVFDLLHRVFEDNGWQFTLDDFPANAASRVGIIKWVLEWCFPAVVLEDRSFGMLAGDPRGDYRQAVFRLPLRQTAPGTPAIYDDRFPNPDDRRRVMKEMVEESARSLLFLKYITSISFSILRDREPEDFARIDATPPPADFTEFLRTVQEMDRENGTGASRECQFPRTVTCHEFAEASEPKSTPRSFYVKHSVRFDDANLRELRERLRRNEERAVPWVSVAVPLDINACQIDGRGPAAWRVFLPLLEKGPSSCVFNASLFIGPSRQRIEYRLNESDEGRRRTDWNRALVEKALVPLLQDLSLELPDLARGLLENHPQEYLSLFPRIAAEKDKESDSGLTGFVSQHFGRGMWFLRLPDLWGERFDIFVGEDKGGLCIEMIADWLGEYRDRFRQVSTPQRRFVRFALGDALATRVAKTGAIKIVRQASSDVALCVLRHPEQPNARDLTRLVQAAARPAPPDSGWEAAWAFTAPDGCLLRYSVENLYVLDDAGQHAAVSALRELRLPFSGVAWIRPNEGLASADVQPRPDNILAPTANAALELLRRLPEDNSHDQIAHAYAIRPVVDFLLSETITRVPGDARLGFLIRTARNKEDRRRHGVILMRPASPTATDNALWEVWFRHLFAEVDPDFAREVSRLLRTHPGLLDMLHAQDCRVVIGTTHDALSILHAVRLRDPQVYDLLEAAMNSGKYENSPQIVAAGLLYVADAEWDRLHAHEQYTVLALPIHRRPDGRFAALVPAQGGDPTPVQTAFRLQSDDDLEDAPVTLPACQLLQTPNAAVRRFYRHRLRLEPHGRVAVLRDVLRQIGEAEGPTNDAMLRYLGRYYDETLRSLEASGDEADAADATGIRELFSSAKTVPCVDSVWRLPCECVSAWRVAERLLQQNWQRARLAALVEAICHGEHVASLEASCRRLVEQLHRLPEVDPGELAERAITSEHNALSLGDRAKLLNDNWRERPPTNVAPSDALRGLEVPALGGRVRLGDAELIELPTPALPPSALRVLAPTAVELNACAKELGLPAERARAVLEVSGVPRCSTESLDDRLVERFPEIWSKIGSGERLQVLGYVGSRELGARLRETATSLDVVQVAARTPRWTLPARILTPRWAETRPPHIPAETQPLLKDVPETVRAIWNDWCGVRSFADVLAVVLAEAERLGDRRAAAVAVYPWLEGVVPQLSPEEFTSPLRDWSWTLAQRGDAIELRRPSDVILHPARQVLAGRFWVPAVPLPGFAANAAPALGFLVAPPSTSQSLRQLAECLAERAVSASVEAAVEAYGLIEQLLWDSDTLDEEWRRLARRCPVFRAFRSEDKQYTALQIFIGDSKHEADLSSGLVCLRSQSGLPKGILSRYRALGVSDVPTIEQVLAALASFGSAEREESAAYGRLVRTLDELTTGSDSPLNHAPLTDLRVRSCAGTYEPLSRCYWDDDFGHTARVAVPHAVRLIDATDKNTHRLINWVRDRNRHAVTSLRTVARVEMIDEPEPLDLTPELSYLLLPWRQWAQEIVREGSVLAEPLARFGLTPEMSFEIVAVHRIRARFYLDAGGVIDQAAEWDGPVALGDGARSIFIRPPMPQVGSRLDARGAVDELDAAIAREVAILLGGRAIFEKLEVCVSEILATLERPSTVLRELRKTYRQHFLHQYHDQVADPKFAELFDEYRRTVPSSKRAGELEERMHELLAEGFVRARREQIRGYGYDEFSVFAELLQNAEDAYIQRALLRMDMPSSCDIVYRCEEAAERRRVLEVEHHGRPFNYWQHGSQQDRSFSRDVEGVLRSAGSFKPHIASPNARRAEVPTIGRFGLGFKSVYLLTDRPEIHSGAWHFTIEAGCLPQEVPPPDDLAEDVTRFRLPLRPDAEHFQDPSQLIERLRDLLPFVSMIRRLEFHHWASASREFNVVPAIVTDILADSTGFIVERITISDTEASGEDAVKFLRCRSRDHAGQVGILLARDGTPARWDEAFNHDLFAVLPLKAVLGCGVAVSHRFEVQSGRTHLVDPKANAGRVTEVAGLLEGLAKALWTCASASTPLSTVLSRFWALWRWDRGDAECKSLREELARTLVGLAARANIVPTLDPNMPTSLAEGPRFYFVELPESFREAIVAANIAIRVAGIGSVALSPRNVVPDGFAGSYRRACEYAATAPARTLKRVDWDEVAHAFQERAWFAEKPELLSTLAESLSEEQAGKAAGWLALCRVLGHDGNGCPVQMLPSELLAPEFPGCRHIPERFLCRLSSAYSPHALDLLEKAGVRARPSDEDLCNWLLVADLTSMEAIGILGYLAEDDRFLEFRELRTFFRSPWFPTPSGRVSTHEAVDDRLIPDDLLANALFRTWLIEGGEPPPPPPPPPLDPREVLENLFAWWRSNGQGWVTRYEARLYPDGQPPSLRTSFSPRDNADRKQWLTLLLLGTLHKLGRVQLEQHRDFLRRCERMGWLDVFADREHDAHRWMQVLEDYLDDPSGRHDYYQWMKQFVEIFQVSRWLSEYVDAILSINRLRDPFALDQILAPRTSAFFSGGGPEAPSLTRALGIGACFVMRELARLGHLQQSLAHRYCYVPSQGVCDLLDALGCSGLEAASRTDQSAAIHRFLAERLGEDRATFDGSFDLPLQAVTSEVKLQMELLRRTLPQDGAPTRARVGERSQTLPDNRRIYPYG